MTRDELEVIWDLCVKAADSPCVQSKEVFQILTRDVRGMLAHIDDLAKEIGQLRIALKPFAELAQAGDQGAPVATCGEGCAAAKVFMADCTRAREILCETEPCGACPKCDNEDAKRVGARG